MSNTDKILMGEKDLFGRRKRRLLATTATMGNVYFAFPLA
jgi:hypothetical protein